VPIERPPKIELVLRNTLYAISLRETIDIEDLFLHNLIAAAEYPKCPKNYAPWIQMIIDLAQGKRYFCRFAQKLSFHLSTILFK
jgi:hypothetical protein